MKDYGSYAIANLIIHEQAHATLFLKGHAQFNEEFATFVGDEGALAYLAHSTASQEEIEAVAARAADFRQARSLILSLRSQLESIYSSGLDEEHMRDAKAHAIERFQVRIRTEYEQLFRTDHYLQLAEIDINNAYIDLYVTYSQDLDLFRALYDQLGRDLPRFVRALKTLENPASIPDRTGRRLARRDPKEYIRTHLLDSRDDVSVE
jgi:predicted aminopeptidase